LRQAIGWAAICALAALLQGGGAAGADTLYRFIDEDGTVHFSNVPSDPRFVAVRTLKTRVVTRSKWGPRNITAYDDIIRDHAGEHGVPAALVKAVIAAESNFDPRARSPKGAQGLMQLMPGTARSLGVADAFDPAQNLDGGVRHLGSLLTLYGGDVSRALAAYNAGEGAVARHGGIPPFKETREYVKKVLQRYEKATK
jgi:soluble lytic murein transglycosylase-like protein